MQHQTKPVQIDTFGVKVACYSLISDKDSLFLLKRQNTNLFDGQYLPPVGHLESGETIANGAIREALEESSVQLEKKQIKLKAVSLMHDFSAKEKKNDNLASKKNYLNVYFGIEDKNILKKAKNMEPDKASEGKVFTYDQITKSDAKNSISKMVVPYFRDLINQLKEQVDQNEILFSMFPIKEHLSKGEFEIARKLSYKSNITFHFILKNQKDEYFVLNNILRNSFLQKKINEHDIQSSLYRIFTNSMRKILNGTYNFNFKDSQIKLFLLEHDFKKDNVNLYFFVDISNNQEFIYNLKNDVKYSLLPLEEIKNENTAKIINSINDGVNYLEIE